ncbi:adenylate kinase family protein [Allocoleopsis franciscana]|uniref:Adenylate kinase n=1 Tax=Allocoleopsis franciscana PCC 7113 TaxID=1173027 RepID=K9WKE7_9CYAN|nr:nucleoside monophosphate kinase [Allocoleopsis franciscana]AFZ20286.1 adenylate kinase family protein [Allocoleopsis franciscana PCC 7113]
MRLVILGGPGAGKGTQARKLCRQLAISEISTSDILRQAIASQSELGRQAQVYVDKGELVPDPILIEFMRNRLLQDDAKGKGWLLEGYPRTAFQAEELDFLLDDLEQQLDWAIYIEVPQSVMMDRCLGRTHSFQGNPKGNNFVKDSRPDDQPEIIQRRLNLFYERTIPILEYYGYRKRLLTINGDQLPEQVEQDILQKLQI